MVKFFLLSESMGKLPYESPEVQVSFMHDPINILTTLSYAEAEIEDLEDLGEW